MKYADPAEMAILAMSSPFSVEMDSREDNSSYIGRLYNCDPTFEHRVEGVPWASTESGYSSLRHILHLLHKGIAYCLRM